MKLYGDFKKEDWMQALKISEQSIPNSFILHGEWEHQENLERWKSILTEEQWASDWNTVIGNINGKRIGFSNVFGGPSAAITAHRYAILGTDKFIQTGYFGGLSHDVEYGDILIVTGAYMEDGVSQWYLPRHTLVHANQKLVSAAISFCEEKGYRYVTGTVMSTSAMYMETTEIVKSWSEEGHLGVDMETATTFAIAKYYNRNAIGLLNLSDHIIQGETFYSRPEELDNLMDDTDRRIRELALFLASLDE
ncbi:nucleoside phosphorylase [Paucisalibacillus sp. EB02]|uniref:nucleoside phosphorylase n=1 Tax=Paucisalibacillus sp. EB02 TaxID=1347087 RepID=UPI0005A766DD|nr:uridine phosphorylase [Paucisalibacillus sp. EB02]